MPRGGAMDGVGSCAISKTVWRDGGLLWYNKPELTAPLGQIISHHPQPQSQPEPPPCTLSQQAPFGDHAVGAGDADEIMGESVLGEEDEIMTDSMLSISNEEYCARSHYKYLLATSLKQETPAKVLEHLVALYQHVTAPKALTAALLDDMLLLGPAIVVPPGEKLGENAKKKKATSIYVGVAYNRGTSRFYGHVYLPASELSHLTQKEQAKYKTVSAKPCPLEIDTARSRDMLLVKMYLCGVRWPVKQPVHLNFLPSDSLEALMEPRLAAIVNYREFAECAFKMPHLEPVAQFHGVYRCTKEKPKTKTKKCRTRDKGGKFVAFVFDKDAECGTGKVCAVVQTRVKKNSNHGLEVQVSAWETPEEAARVRDQEVIRMGAFVDYKLNYPLSGYVNELRSSPQVRKLMNLLKSGSCRSLPVHLT